MIIAALLLALGIRTQTETLVIPMTDTGIQTTYAGRVKGFDATLGTLQAVHIDVYLTGGCDAGVENTSQYGGNCGIGAGCPCIPTPCCTINTSGFTLTKNNGTVLCSPQTATPTANAYLDPSDGTVDFAGASGCTFHSEYTYDYQHGEGIDMFISMAPADLTYFTGKNIRLKWTPFGDFTLWTVFPQYITYHLNYVSAIVKFRYDYN